MEENGSGGFGLPGTAFFREITDEWLQAASLIDFLWSIWYSYTVLNHTAWVVELVDTWDLKSHGRNARTSSTLVPGTSNKKDLSNLYFFRLSPFSFSVVIVQLINFLKESG